MRMSPLLEIVRHDSWANRRLFEFCQALPGEVLQASSPGTYGSIIAPLVHLLAAEERYRSIISGQRPDDMLKEGREPPFDDLQRAWSRLPLSGTSKREILAGWSE